MAGNDAFGGDGRKPVKIAEPALQGAVDDRQVTDENEVAREKRARGLVEDGKVTVRVRRRPGLQFQGPVSEIDRHDGRRRSRSAE